MAVWPSATIGRTPSGREGAGPRAEADQAEALAGPDGDAFAHEGDDPAGDQAGDLHHHDASAARGGDDEAVALVVLARLVEIGIEEGARVIGDALDAAADGTAIHVAVEHAHEDRDPRERLVAPPASL